VFTARYELSPYIKQIGFVFKGLIKKCTLGHPRSCHVLFINHLLFLISLLFAGYIAIIAMAVFNKSILSSTERVDFAPQFRECCEASSFTYTTGAQIPGARSLWRLHFVQRGPNIYGSSVWNLLLVTLLARRIFG
jgi:hypothetical protein